MNNDALMMKKFLITLTLVLFIAYVYAQSYPKGYFRHPLSIPMELVSNFGELRTNHWHMGLDIRTQQRENLRVYASAEGYIAKVKIEPGGFGRAIYINHPNGYTTLYAHLNNLMPALEKWVKQEQYRLESWQVDLQIPPHLFPVKKGDFIAFSGNTGGSAGPHVHFEIRDTKTDECLNPLLFGFPIADAVPPSISRLAMYDRNKSVYHQSPQYLALKRVAGGYTLSSPSNLIKVGSDKISFAITAVDRFTKSPNPNGIFTARVLIDGTEISSFLLDRIDYNDTRYMNAHIDYRVKQINGSWLQHLSAMPGDYTDIYNKNNNNGAITLLDREVYKITILVQDAAKNTSRIQFKVQYDPSLAKAYKGESENKLIPREVSVFEESNFEAYTTEFGVYDTVNVSFSNTNNGAKGSVSPLYHFIGHSIPVHDAVTIRIKPEVKIDPADQDKMVIKNIAGTRTYIAKAKKSGDWYMASFRQFGNYQLFIDNDPPVINNIPTDLSKATRIAFTPTDNVNNITYFRAELDGKWLRFTNNRGKTWLYYFDEYFSKGEHELKVVVEDAAGNRTVRTWKVRR